MPGSAARYSISLFASGLPYAIINGCAIIRIAPGIGAPFPQVAMQVVQAEGVGWKLIDHSGGVAIDPFRLAAIHEFAVVVCDFSRESFAKVEGRRCPGAAGIFSLCLAGQAINMPGALREAFTETHGVEPRHTFDRQSIARKAAMWFSRNGLPLRLSDQAFTHEKRRDGDMMCRAFIIVALFAKCTQAKRSTGQGDQFQIEAVAHMLHELASTMSVSILHLAAIVQGNGGEFDL